MSVNIIKDALEFYDNNNEKYENIKKKIKYIRIIPSQELHEDIIGTKLSFYDKNKNELFASRIEFLGNYYNKINVWVWGWSIPILDKSLSTIIRKVFLYGTDIDITPYNFDNILLKNELITSRFRIIDEVQLEIHCAIASYLSKKPFIFIWKDIDVSENEFGTNVKKLTEIKGEFTDIDANVTSYMFIVDPPII